MARTETYACGCVYNFYEVPKQFSLGKYAKGLGPEMAFDFIQCEKHHNELAETVGRVPEGGDYPRRVTEEDRFR